MTNAIEHANVTRLMTRIQLRSRTLTILIAAALIVAHPRGQDMLRRDGLKAFVGARLFDGTGGPPVENAVVLIRDGRILAAGPATRVKVPVEAQRVDVAHRFIVPGLVNAHGHVGETRGLSSDAANATMENVRAQLALYAHYGVTTVFSLGGDHDPSFQLRDTQDTIALDRARVYVAGPVIAPTTPDEARRMVREVAQLGANIVKIRVDDNLGTTPKMPEPVYQAVIEEAHQAHLRVAAHLFYLDDAKSLVKSGADFIAHSVRDKDTHARSIRLHLRDDARVLLRSVLPAGSRPGSA
jgi:imidazolonepropionase-like amidohydrolase